MRTKRTGKRTDDYVGDTDYGPLQKSPGADPYLTFLHQPERGDVRSPVRGYATEDSAFLKRHITHISYMMTPDRGQPQ